MTRKSDKMSTEQRNGDSWLSKILSNPNDITAGAWDALQPPVPTNDEEKKALEQELEIGGYTVTMYQVRKQILIELMESTALRLLVALNDEDKIEKATLQQVAIAWGILTDKTRLAKGEPTAIYRHEDVRKLDELGAALMTEMKRRGIAIEGELAVEETA